MKKEDIIQTLIILLGIFGVTINFMLYNDWHGIFYYTILSNIYVTLFYMVSLIKKLRGTLVKNNKYYWLKGFMLLTIVSTMFIYFAAVNAKDSIYTGHPLECYIVHIVIPILAIIDCACFEDKGVLKYRSVPQWCIPGIVYMFILIGYNNIFNGKFLEGKTYPYDIINFEKLGILKGTINSLAILVFFAVVGIVIVYLDNKMVKKK